MNIPSSIRIGGVDYSVKRTPSLNTGTQMAYGYIDYEKSTIELTADLDEKVCYQKLCCILLHEILHGIQHHIGVPLGSREEDIIDMFARGLFQVFQDNDSKLFGITETKSTESEH